MAMSAYLDESGTHGKQSPLVIIAGFVATAEQWTAYESALIRLLATFDVTTFHARKLRGSKGEFKNWSLTKHADFNSRFLRLIDEHLSSGFATVLPSTDYAEIYRSAQFPRRARPHTQYGLCFRAALLKLISSIKDRKANWPLNIFLEDGHRNAPDAARIFTQFRTELIPEYQEALGYLRFCNKRNSLLLAPADSLAYAMFRMTAGYSRHPTLPNAAVVGPAEPRYYVHKIPMSRTLVDNRTLTAWRNELTNS